ncbi:MAG: hypothetical protein WBG57_10495 [Ornithinimicrobium sp.]
MDISSEEPLPALPLLADTWCDDVRPGDEAGGALAVSSLRATEAALTEYRRALHARIGEATGELVVRYSANPSIALQVLGA